MTFNETVNYLLRSNHMVLQKAVAGVSHEESLRTLPDDGGSNMNWILGHIVLSRNSLCAMIGHPPICAAHFERLYGRGTKSHDPVPFLELVDTYNDSHDSIAGKISAFDPAKDERSSKELTFLCFHEAYHIGQLGSLRRMLGKDGVAG